MIRLSFAKQVELIISFKANNKFPNIVYRLEDKKKEDMHCIKQLSLYNIFFMNANKNW